MLPVERTEGIAAPVLLNDLNVWRCSLGLLPIALFPNQSRAYVLANGASGNFCLDLEAASDEAFAAKEGRSWAWSSDVGHYVSLKGPYVQVRSWNRREYLPENFSAVDVAQQLHKFHEYLERGQPNRDQSIVAHVLRIFGQLRALLPESASAEQTIRHFLILLQQSADVEVLDPAVADQLRYVDIEALKRELCAPLPQLDLQPSIPLMLRHASGAMFQEAHYRAVQPINMSLPGILPLPAIRKNETRKDAGVFFTPPSLARTAVEESLRALRPWPARLQIFDPACGSGEFLKEAIRQLELESYAGQLVLVGWDKSAVSVEMTKFCLAYESKQPKSFSIEFRVECRDSLLEESWPSSCDAILMNPPFAALQFLTEEAKSAVKAIVGKGRPNLAAAFLLRAIPSVKVGGILMSVVPSSITDGDSTRPVRERLAQYFSPLLVAKLGSQTVFTNAIVDAGLYIGKREDSKSGDVTRVVWADHQSGSLAKALRTVRSIASNGSAAFHDERGFSIYPSTSIGRTGDVWTPAPYKIISQFERLSGLPRLGELFEIKQGIRLGHDVFLITRDQLDELPEGEQRFFRPAVINASLRKGRLSEAAFAWYPDTPGLPALKSEDDLGRYVPKYFEMLRAEKDKLARRAIGKSPWWTLVRARGWQAVPAPKIVTTYFGQEGSVGYDDHGRFVVVVGHAWLPAGRREINPELAYAYVALCSSRLFGELLQACSTHVGGGQLSLENKFIRRLPVPDLWGRSFSLNVVRDLAEVGFQISRGHLGGLQSKANDLALQAYRV